MGALCSTYKGARARGEAQVQVHSLDSIHSSPAPNISKKRPLSSTTEEVTRQTMGETREQRLKRLRQARADVVTIEDSQAFDAHAVATASELEKQASDIVAAVRKEDEEKVYAKSLETFHRVLVPAGHFLSNVGIIEETKLFKIAQRMPKGAHLHCHFNSCLKPNFLLEHARGRESMYIHSTVSLTSEKKRSDSEITFQVLPPQKDVVNLFSRSYVDNKDKKVWMNYPKFCKLFEGGEKAAEKWLISKMLLNEEEVYGINQTGTSIWKRFDVCTRMIKGLFSYETAFREYTKACIQDFIDDNIQYAEIRPNFPSNALMRDDGMGYIDNKGLLQIIEDEMRLKMTEQGGKGRAQKMKEKGQEEKEENMKILFDGMKVIYCTPRSFQKEQIKASLNECIFLKGEFPTLLCGYDLVGSEDRGFPLNYFMEELVDFQVDCIDAKVDIPFLFHAGETLDTGTSTDQNLIDAIVLDSKRIGHGFALPKHPEAMRLIKEKNIALEICPISNEVLGLCSTVRGHTLPILLANNVHCTVNSDNGTFYSSTLSHDFYQVMVGSNEMTLHGWRVLAEWSLEHSCMNPEEKSAAKENWLNEWKLFCQWIVDNYGPKKPPRTRSQTQENGENSP